MEGQRQQGSLTAKNRSAVRELPPEQAACDAWPRLRGRSCDFSRRSRKGFHEDHEAEEYSALRAELNYGRREAPESSFLLLRENLPAAS
jgi:hypothetical protein